MNRRVLSGLLLVSLLALLAYWLGGKIEWYSASRYTGFKGEARSNDYLAAEWFLKRMGIQADTIESPASLDELPTELSTLIIPTDRSTLSIETSEELLQWAKNGGHLIVKSLRPYADDYADPDPILDEVGLVSALLDYSEVDDGAGTTTSEVDDSNDLMEIDFHDAWAIETSSPFFEDDIVMTVGDVFGDHLVSVKYFKGKITAVTDFYWLENYSIEEHGHARLLFVLTRDTPADGLVWLLRSDDMPPLWKWLWQVAPEACILALGLLLLWLLRAPRRLGPLLPAALRSRRSILEHIDASGHFLWNTGKSEQLLQGLRDDLMLRVIRLHPDLYHQDNDARMHRLGEITGLNAQHVHEAMNTAHPRDKTQFVSYVRTLENIRNRL